MIPNLEMQVNRTNAGLYTVAYGRKEAPLDVQEAAFAANNLSMVSPAQLGFLRAREDTGIFKPYSRTSADVFYDNKNNQVVIVPDGAISRLVGRVGIANLVEAHRKNKEYVIPEAQRDLVYGMIDEMLSNGTAFTFPHGQTSVATSEFGKNDLTLRMFSDKNLGFEAQEYGEWLKSQGREVNSFFMDDKSYAQKASYLNRLRLYGPVDGFGVEGNGNLDYYDGAFGVRFEKTASDMRGELGEPRSPATGVKK